MQKKKERKEHTYWYRGHHLPGRKEKKEKKKRNKKTGKKRRGAEYRTRELRLYSLMVLPPTPLRYSGMNLPRAFTLPFCTPPHAYPPFSMQWWCVDAVVVITGVWCVAKKKGTYGGHHLRCPSQSHQRSARGRTRLTTVTSISCRSL